MDTVADGSGEGLAERASQGQPAAFEQPAPAASQTAGHPSDGSQRQRHQYKRSN
ncbi:MAG: hypothetical protein GY796_26225 [Chloroflexi bacterium]|nr:hypothetical protein [Chloroflexota bacterium]